MRRLKCLDEVLGVKILADFWNVLRGVEVEMDLAIAQRLDRAVDGHGHSLFPLRLIAPAANCR